MDSELRKRSVKEKEHVNKESKVAENRSAQLEKYIWIPITVSLTSLLLVLAILTYFLNQQEQLQQPIKPQRRTRIERTSEEVPYEYNFIKESVKRITLTPSNTHFANEIAAKGEPVIISNSAAEKWAALDVWTPSYFIAHIPSFANIQKHHNKTFYYYHASKPMSKLVPSYSDLTWDKVNMSSKEFFTKVLFQRVNVAELLAAQLSDLGDVYPDMGYADVHPMEPFIVKGEDYSEEESHKYRWTNVWIGAAGATTQAHFDVYYNFYVQVHGKKRFILFPPAQHENLYINPFLHPGALQSQVDFDNPDLERFPNFRHAAGLQATLSKGDVLFIPPLWFHHVTALDSSISVSVWSKCKEAKTIQDTWKGQLPFRSSWSTNTLYTATKLYLKLLIERVNGQGSSGAFIRRLLELRYSSIIKDTPTLLSDAPFCDLLEAEEEQQLIAELTQEFNSVISSISEKFIAVPDNARREIWLQHLCEQIAFSIVGVENVAKFFQDFVECN